MASNVNAALGTQRQFSAQPKGTYEQRLASLPAHVGVTAPTSTDGLALARSLGVLGDTLETYAASTEKNKEKIGIAEAERIIASRSEEDMKKLSAIEMINNYGNFELADNPYAVSTIEKMRGKYLGAKARNEYEAEIVSKEGRAKTSQEEAERYDKFVRDRYKEYMGVATDQQAFEKGFFDNHIVNQLEQAHQQIKVKSEEYRAIAIGTTQANLSEIVAKAPNMKPEELNEAINKVFAESRLSGVDIPTRIEITKQFLKEYAQNHGDYSTIDAITKNVVIGTDANGQQVKISDVIPMGDINKLADMRTTQIFGEKVQKSLKELQGMTPEQANAKFAEWQKSDPHWFNVMLPYRDNIYQFHEKKEQQKKIAEFKASAKKYARGMSFEVLENQWNAFQSGNNKDVQGYVVAAHYGDLPKFEYTYVDDSGNTTTKAYDWNKEDVNAYVDYKLNQIKAENLTPEQRSAKTMKLLTWPPAKHYSDSLKMVIQNSLDTISVDKLPTDSEGKPKLTDQIEDAVQMYRTDPEAFQHLFGQKTTNDIEAIQLLSAATNDTKQGVTLFAMSRDKRNNDPEFVKTKRSDVANRLSSSRLSGFLGIDGDEAGLNVSVSTNRSVYRRAEALATTLTLTGMDSSQAVEMALNKIKENTYVYKDTAIPRTVFNGILTDNKAAIGKQVLDYYVWKFCEDTGTNPAYVSTEYDIDRGVFRINNESGNYTAYNINDISFSGNYILQQQANDSWSQGGRNITLDEVNEARQDKWSQEQLPEGTYWGD